MKITDALLAEHTVFHGLFDYIEQKLHAEVSACEIGAYAELMLHMLEKHGATEHDVLLPPLEPFLHEIGQYEKFHLEDEVIIGTLKQIPSTESLEESKQILINTIRLAREHFDKEERFVFPLAENTALPTSNLTLTFFFWAFTICEATVRFQIRS